MANKRHQAKQLTPQMKRFAEEYLVDLSATKAAERAGYSVKTANEQGAMLKKHPLVAELIQDLMDQRSERTKLSADRLLQELAVLALADLGEAYKDGQLMKVSDMPESIRRAIASVDITMSQEDMTAKVRTHDKLKALELYGKHLKLFTDKVEHSGSVGIADALAAARERVKKGKADV